jgi:microcystin-dependent protein
MEGSIGEIRMFAGNFAPRGWLFCQGQLLSIAQYSAVFAIVGTTYGGDGQTTFAVPDFRGRIGTGAQFSQGPGLPAVQLGEKAGTPNITLTLSNLPAHTHAATLNASTTAATSQTPVAGAVLGRAKDNAGTAVPQIYAPTGSTTGVALGSSSVTTAPMGGNQPFSTMQPYLGMNFIFCVEGIFPSRN